MQDGEEATLLLKLSARASARGWYWLSGFFLELDLAFSGLSGASRRIRREQERRRRSARVPFAAIEGNGG